MKWVIIVMLCSIISTKQLRAQEWQDSLNIYLENYKLLVMFKYGDALYGHSPICQMPVTYCEKKFRSWESDELRELKEKIIKIYLKLKPSPSLSEDARMHFIRGKSLQDSAKSKNDYSRACKEYELAIQKAPWMAIAYYNLAKIESYLSFYGRAVRDFKYYLLASPNAQDKREVQDEIYRLEFKRDAEKEIHSNLCAGWDYYVANSNTALYYFTKALNIDSKNIVALYYVGLCYYNKGDIDKWRNYWEKACELNLDSFDDFEGFSNWTCEKLKEYKNN